MNKTCNVCNQLKPVEDFVSGVKVYDWCKECRGLLSRKCKLPPKEATAFRTKNAQLKSRREYKPPRTLKPDTVKLVRTMHSKGMPISGIARGMNIGRTTVSDIVNNKTYRWVE